MKNGSKNGSTKRPNDEPQNQVLGSVGELAASWRVKQRLMEAASLGQPYAECLRVTVEASRRAKIQAGAAYTKERRIVLNSALIRPGRERDRNATFLHECAHILADLNWGRNCGHDWRWEQIMEMLGEDPVVRHQIHYISARAHAVVTWLCDNCGERYYFVRPPRRKIQDCYCRPCGPRRGQLRLEAE